MTQHDFPRCAPEEIGLSSAQVASCIRALNHDLATMNGFMAARYGKVFTECWWAPFRAGLVHSNHSFGKSYTATAICLAQQEGKLHLDERMADVFAEEIASRSLTLDERTRRITIRHVLTMTNGMAHHPDMAGDWIGNYFATPMAHEPGTRFAYNSSGSCMLGAILLKRTGQNLKEYLTPRLFDKIGIDASRFVWCKFPNGIDGEPGTFATTEDNLRLAQLYCDGGKWNGEQILDPNFVREALSVQIENPYAPEQKDGRCGYGYQLWACSIPGVFRFDGGQGQYGIIWPEKQLVISLHEGAFAPVGPQKTLDVLYEHLLLPLLDEPLPPSETDYRALLALEHVQALPESERGKTFPDDSWNGTYAVQSGVFDPWFAVAPPGVGDLFAAFRTPEHDLTIQGFTLWVLAGHVSLSLDSGAQIHANLDGSLQERAVATPFPALRTYAATARMLPEGVLELRIRWLNGWFETILLFVQTSNGLIVTMKKLRLNAADNYLIETCFAVRQS
jgi:CubicO group peptidase (beta-lactamase class C family)